MKTIDDLRKILSLHKDALKRDYNVSEIGIFGSFARNEASETSDVDILVAFTKPIGFFRFLELEDHLRILLEVPKVDLVTRNALKPRIGKSILQEVVSV